MKFGLKHLSSRFHLALGLSSLVVSVLLMALPFGMKIGSVSLRPGLITFVTTFASGFTFITSFKILMNVPTQIYIYGMLPVVVFTAVANTVIAQLLYYPARKLLGQEEE